MFIFTLMADEVMKSHALDLNSWQVKSSPVQCSPVQSSAVRHISGVSTIPEISVSSGKSPSTLQFGRIGGDTTAGKLVQKFDLGCEQQWFLHVWMFALGRNGLGKAWLFVTPDWGGWRCWCACWPICCNSRHRLLFIRSLFYLFFNCLCFHFQYFQVSGISNRSILRLLLVIFYIMIFVFDAEFCHSSLCPWVCLCRVFDCLILYIVHRVTSCFCNISCLGVRPIRADSFPKFILFLYTYICVVICFLWK